MTKPYDQMSEAEQAAYRQGRAAFIPRDQTVFNPYDADEEADLYEAWQSGFDDA